MSKILFTTGLGFIASVGFIIGGPISAVMSATCYTMGCIGIKIRTNSKSLDRAYVKFHELEKKRKAITLENIIRNAT